MPASRNEIFTKADDLLIKAINSGGDGTQIGEDLFGAADLLAANSGLRNALTDPARSAESKKKLVQQVFDGVVSSAALQVLILLSGHHWTAPMALAEAVGGLGLDTYIRMAIYSDDDQTLAQELIDAQTLIAANRQLRVQLSDIGEGKPADRAELAKTIFQGRVSNIAERLIVRAAFSSPFGRLIQTLRDYANRAAEVTDKHLIIAHTAKELSEDQYYRLARLAARRWQCAVLMVRVVDPQLVGGFRLDSGEESVDTTIQTDIAAARMALAR